MHALKDLSSHQARQPLPSPSCPPQNLETFLLPQGPLKSLRNLHPRKSPMLRLSLYSEARQTPLFLFPQSRASCKSLPMASIWPSRHHFIFFGCCFFLFPRTWLASRISRGSDLATWKWRYSPSIFNLV